MMHVYDRRNDLSQLTAPEVQTRQSREVVALIPIGATEQHGPHLALGTDWRIAHELALAAAERLSPQALVTPPLPFGMSQHHMGFTGTITLEFETLQAVCVDVVQSLAQHDIEKFIFVNGHRGNEAPLSVIMTHLKYRLGIEVASSFWMTQARDAIDKHVRTRRWGHACEIETSLAMALAPDLVREDALQPGDLIEDYRALEDNYEPYSLALPRSFAERTRNGSFGDATLASRAAGEEIAAVATDRLVEFAHDFLQAR